MLKTGIECNVVLILIFVNSEALTSIIRYFITAIDTSKAWYPG